MCPLKGHRCSAKCCTDHSCPTVILLRVNADMRGLLPVSLGITPAYCESATFSIQPRVPSNDLIKVIGVEDDHGQHRLEQSRGPSWFTA